MFLRSNLQGDENIKTTTRVSQNKLAMLSSNNILATVNEKQKATKPSHKMKCKGLESNLQAMSKSDSKHSPTQISK